MAMGRQRITQTQNTEEMSRKMTVTYSARLSKAESWESAEFCLLQGKHCYQRCFLQQAFSGMLCVTLRDGLPERGIRAEVQQSIIRDKVCCQNTIQSNGTPTSGTPACYPIRKSPRCEHNPRLVTQHVKCVQLKGTGCFVWVVQRNHLIDSDDRSFIEKYQSFHERHLIK